MPALHTVVSALDSAYPRAAAESWDPVGLLSGQKSQEITRALIVQDLTWDVVDRAVSTGCQLIVLHHPPFFPKATGGVQSFVDLREDSNQLRDLVMLALRRGIALYVAHTNFDRMETQVTRSILQAMGGGSKWLGRLAGKNAEPLSKLQVYVPIASFADVEQAAFDAGAGHIGQYDECGFHWQGKGSFRPLENSNPSVGSRGVRERPEEIVFSTILPKFLESRVLSAVRKAHPYEEMAYEFIDVRASSPTQKPSDCCGIGLVAEFGANLSSPEVIDQVLRAFSLDSAWITPALRSGVSGSQGSVLSPPQAPAEVRRWAFSPGSGSGFLGDIRRWKPELYITGELSYHEALDLARAGVTSLQLGHRESEIFFLTCMHDFLGTIGLPSDIVNRTTQSLVKRRENP